MNMKYLFETVRKSTFPPVLHGNGFLQFQFDDDNSQRLHIWSRELPRQKVATQIHNHTFGFQSEILYGSLLNRIYSIQHQYLDALHYICEAVAVPESKDTNLIAIVGGNPYAKVTRKYDQVLDTGNIYDMPPFEYHESIPITDLVVTFMTKTIKVPNFKARVLCKIGENPDNDFSRHALDIDLAWNVFEKASKLIL